MLPSRGIHPEREHKVEKYKFYESLIPSIFFLAYTWCAGLLFGGVGIGLCLYYVSSIRYSKAEEEREAKDSQICLGAAAASLIQRVTFLVL